MNRIHSSAGLGLALSLITLSSACTSKTQGYCERDSDCAAAQRCNTTLNRCEALSPDGGGDAPLSDGDLSPSPDQGKLPNGAKCSNPGQCQSGHCVVGVCCNAACQGTCRSCKLPGEEGTCTLAPAGSNPGGVCSGLVGLCYGTCDGRGQCSYPGSDTSCGPFSCNMFGLTTDTCDGKGACVTTFHHCGGFGCDSTVGACMTSCSTKADCFSSFDCVNQVCSGALPNSYPCGTNDAACQSKHCVEGYCCDTLCTDPCKSCAIKGQLGTCSVVADNTPCAADSCSGGTLTVKRCTSGTCSDMTSSCGLFLCNPEQTACLTACAGDSHCVANAFCDADKVCQLK